MTEIVTECSIPKLARPFLVRAVGLTLQSFEKYNNVVEPGIKRSANFGRELLGSATNSFGGVLTKTAGTLVNATNSLMPNPVPKNPFFDTGSNEA